MEHVLIASQMRMGKGKGSFDHWATRMAVNQVLFEIRGNVHQQVVRDAFRLAGNKLPGKKLGTLLTKPTNEMTGQWEFVMKGDAPIVGITKLDGVTLEELKRPRRHIAPVEMLNASPTTTETMVGSTSESSRNP